MGSVLELVKCASPGAAYVTPDTEKEPTAIKWGTIPFIGGEMTHEQPPKP
jgi:hypothetical protein